MISSRIVYAPRHISISFINAARVSEALIAQTEQSPFKAWHQSE